MKKLVAFLAIAGMLSFGVSNYVSAQEEGATPADTTQVAQTETPAAAPVAAGGDLHAKLAGLGLTKDQVEGVLALTRDVIEKAVWEVVPQMAEMMIKEEIERLTKD